MKALAYNGPGTRGHEAVGAVQSLGSSEPGRSAWRQSRHASCEARPVTSSNV